MALFDYCDVDDDDMFDDDVDNNYIGDMSLKEINEYVEARYQKYASRDNVQTYAGYLDDVTATQMIASYIMQHKTCSGFISSKEDLIERVTELINDNYYFIDKRLS